MKSNQTTTTILCRNRHKVRQTTVLKARLWAMCLLRTNQHLTQVSRKPKQPRFHTLTCSAERRTWFCRQHQLSRQRTEVRNEQDSSNTGNSMCVVVATVPRCTTKSPMRIVASGRTSWAIGKQRTHNSQFRSRMKSLKLDPDLGTRTTWTARVRTVGTVTARCTTHRRLRKTEAFCAPDRVC